MDVHGSWARLSIRRKTLIWLAMLISVLLSMMGISAVIRSHATSELARLQNNDTLCYAVQATLKEEHEALELVLRTRSQTDRQHYEAACAATVEALAALPSSYESLGEERSARTWNLQNGYSGYREYRDALLDMDPASADYSASYYRVMAMLDDLSIYALRLGQATLEQGSALYGRTLRAYEALPFLSLFLLLMSFLAAAGIFDLLDGSLIRPIQQMSAQSRCIAGNEFDIPDLDARSDDEVGELIRAFNRMKHATRDHITTLEENNRMESELHRRELERLELEKNLDHTRLEMLKSQVNPHFLFNTLNMISCMARLEDAEDTDKMILSLSGIFRYNLRTKEQVVLLQQELEALDDYIYIQQTRFDGRIAYQKKIEVDPMQVRIPSFTLQPIVENAFIHGLARREEGGRIFLRIWQEGHMLLVSVADNGAGMTAEALTALHERMHQSEQTGRGIGLGNISRRISMLYPEGDLRIHSRPGRGTVIQCRIPQSERSDP